MNNEPGRMLDTLRRILPDDATTVQGGPDDASIEAKRPMVCIRRVKPQTPPVDATGKTPGELLRAAFESMPGEANCADAHEDAAKAVIDAFGNQPSAEVLHQERLDLLEQMFAQARLRARCAPPHEDMLPREVGFEIAMATYREWLSMAQGKCGVS